MWILYACMHVCVCIYIYTRLSPVICKNAHTFVSARTNEHTYVHTHVHTYIHTYL